MPLSISRLQRSLKGGGSKPIDTTPRAPTNVNPPTINNTSPVVGQTLSAGNGYWDAWPFPTYTYQWQADTAGNGTFADIVGATNATYVVTSDELGDDIRVEVTATNTEGSDVAYSAETAAVAAQDTTPTAFSFTDVTDATISTVYTSNTITVAGINFPADITVTGGEYSINGGAWTSSAGEVENGDEVRVRGTSSGSYSTAVNVVLDIGGVSDTYTITTEVNPALFSINTPLLFEGDSNTAYNYRVNSWGKRALAHAGGRYWVPPGGWFAAPGAGVRTAVYGTNSMESRQAAVVDKIEEMVAAFGACVVYFQIGTNSSPSAASDLATLEDIVAAYKAAGATVLANGAPYFPPNSYVNTLNAGIYAFTDLDGYVDTFAEIDEGAHTGDATHFNDVEDGQIGVAAGDLLLSLITPDDIYTDDATNLVTNGELTGTSGTNGTGASGSVADGWSVQRTIGDGTIVNSKTTLGGKTAQKIEVTAGASNTYVTMTRTVTRTMAVGEIIDTWATIDFADLTDAAAILHASIAANGGNFPASSGVKITTANWTLPSVWRTYPVTDPDGGSSYTITFGFQVAAGETASMIIADVRSVLRDTAAAALPVNTVAPVMSPAIEGQPPSCTDGTWTGTAPITYAKQFYLDSDPIADTYEFTSGDVGKDVTCYVTASNSAGSAAAVQSDVVQVAAEDTTPAAFTFTDVTDADLSTVYTSNTITVSGINAPAAISISGGSGEYQINSGSWTSSSGSVTNGQTVKVRVTSSGSNSTGVSTTLTIGGVSDTYTVTTAAAGGYDSDAQAYFDAMTSAPNTTRKDLLDDLIVGLKGDGVWAKLDALYIMAAHDAQAARVNAVDPTNVASAVNSPTFTTDRGYAGNGSTSYLDTGWNPSTAGGNFAQNSASIGIWSRTDFATATYYDIGNGSNCRMNSYSGLLTIRGTINNSTNTNWGTPTNGLGLFTLTRTASTTAAGYRNATSLGTDSASSVAVTNANINIGRVSTDYSARELAVAFFGGGLSGTDVSNLHSRLSTYLTAVGAI